MRYVRKKNYPQFLDNVQSELLWMAMNSRAPFGTFRRHIGKRGNVRRGSLAIYMPTGTRSGTTFEELVGLSPWKLPTTEITPTRTSPSELEFFVTRRVYIAPNCTRAHVYPLFSEPKREVLYRSRLPSLLAHVRIGFPREISTAGYKVLTND